MFKKALIESARRLSRLRADGLIEKFAVIGAFAASRFAVPRATGDIDYAVKPGSAGLEGLARAVKGECRIGDVSDPLMGSVSFRVSKGGLHVPVQLIQFPPAWERIALEETEKQKVNGAIIPFASWQAMVLLKLYAASPLDLRDAELILQGVRPGKKELDTLIAAAGRLRVSRRLQNLLIALRIR